MANTRKPRNGAELLKAIKPTLAEESCRVCLRPDLLEEYNAAQQHLEELTAERERLQREAGGSKGGRLASRTSEAEQAVADQQRAAAEKVQAIETKMADYEIEFWFRALDKDKWQDIVAANPPRDGDQLDMFSGYNRDAVLDECVRPSLFDPEFDDCAKRDCAHDDCGTWQALTKLINAGQWQRMRDTAGLVNNGVVDVPKSQTASEVLSKFADASKQPESGESPPAASKAGNRRRSTTTTTPTESS